MPLFPFVWRLLLLLGLVLSGGSALAAPVTPLEGWADEAGLASREAVVALPASAWQPLPPGRVVEQPHEVGYWSALGTQAYWVRVRARMQSPLPAGGDAAAARWLAIRPAP